MPSNDPLTTLVAAWVLPTATAACLSWSLYLLAAGAWAGGQTARPLAKGSTPIRRPVAAR